MRRTTKILFLLFLILLLMEGFFGFNLLPVFADSACNDHVVISEIYGGGGNKGATYKNDFIELYNPTMSNVIIDGWSVQYASLSSENENFSVTKLEDNIIKAGGYYLIQETSGDNGTVDLPTPDAKGNIAMSATAGKVALVNSTTIIASRLDTSIIDFVEYESGTSEFEGTDHAPAPSNTQSIARKSSICLDSNDNSADFTAQDPTPGSENEKIVPICIDKIILSEIYPFTGKFVEVENIGTERCDLAGWKISDEKNSPHTFLANSFIDPGKYFAFIHDFNLNSTSADSAKLFNPTNSEPIEIRSYENPESNKSYSKNESGEWKWTSKLTSGLKNVFDEDLPLIIPPKNSDYTGKLKINEIFPAPKDKNAGKEFVEIINLSDEIINLSGMRIEDEKNTNKLSFPDKLLAPKELFYLEGDFELNNTTPDTAFLIDKDGTKENPIDSVSYANPKYDYAYAFNGSVWQWTSRETRGAENQFDELLSGQIKKDKTIYAGTYANFEVKTDAKAEHFTWNFGDGHKSYLKKTRHKYEDSGIYLASLKLTGEGEDNLLNFEVEVIKYPTPKIKIVKIKANPKGKDALGEEIYLKNTSKKKINLKTWSIATGSKILYNHPITKDFVIQPGKTKKITRKYSIFTLNNKKGAIELRYPNGEVASRVKYDKKKETVKDDEVYELSGKKWQWTAPAEEIPSGEVNLPEGSSAPEENSENINPETDLEISDEEISLNLGKYSSENKIALAEIKFKSAGENLLQSRETPGIVLGAFSARGENHKPIEIKSVNSWQKTLQKSNQLFNLLINQFIRLI